MKVIAKKIFHEMDLYHYPDENTSYGLFGLGGGFIKNAPRRKDPERVHKKGDFKEWKFKLQETCCLAMTIALQEEKISPVGFGENISVSIRCSCWQGQTIKINFCPFCGKEIEIEEEK